MRFIAALLLLLASWPAVAHIGSPNVFFEGMAGPYRVHVVIHPAEVIPGLAEISVRVEGNPGTIDEITALPIKWDVGHHGAPPPDIARPVAGETNLYHAQLWFMEPGAQSVEVQIKGAGGSGKVMIPVDAIARRVLGMPKALGGILVVLGTVLGVLLLSVIGGAVRESVLAPGVIPSRGRRWGARGAIALGAVVLTLLLWGGKRWWDAEASEYRNNRLYQTLDAEASVRLENEQRILRLEVKDFHFTRVPLVPDHGKLMHMFLVREPEMDAFAHLHPVKRDRAVFETRLPDLPAGNYRVYADVTYETGFSDTLTAAAVLPGAPKPVANPGGEVPDADDSWRLAEGSDPAKRESRLNARYTMSWNAPNRLAVNEPLSLRFTVRDDQGAAVAPGFYLGMRGHLALRRADGSVFTHLHPGGTASMAAMQLAVLRSEGKLPLKAAFGESEPICQLPDPTAGDRQWVGGAQAGAEVAFPYAFPKPGRYRLWIQVKVDGEILTGVFDAVVNES